MMDDARIRKKIMSSACSIFDTTEEEIKSPTRMRHVVDARKVIVYFLRTHLKSNIGVVAKVINKKKCGVGYMLGAAENLIESDMEFKLKVNRIRTTIGLGVNSCPCCGRPLENYSSKQK